ncbi:exodeoxyribonuclease V subunit gamma [Naumannella sp. ID2617S]|nr:exodeoxyribonuclease V subunit gamma [Naumannella sp. ID2617S]
MTEDAQPTLLEAPTATPAAGLVVHRCSRADRLAEGLAEVLARPLPDPFATEIVCVPAPGVERWLSQTLSMQLGASAGQHDGVCAGIDFARFDPLLERVVGQALGIDPADDPWRGDRPVWALLRAAEAGRGEPWFAGLRVSFGEDARHRFQTARRVVRLFRSYAVQRPELVNAWSAGANTGPGGAPLESFSVWQPELWRRWCAEVGAPHPAQRVALAADRLAAAPELAELPERLSVFGPTRLNPAQRTLLRALALHREVHLFLPHPSPALWRELAADPTAPGPRASDPTADLPGSRLLARLGRDTRELQTTLSPLDFRDDPRPEPGRPDTLLGRLQRSVVDNLDPATQPSLRRTLAATDRSVHFHSCHGPDRQVEVLREVVLGLLADDPTLEPRDIIVMCPDIETFAPLIQATFGLDGAESDQPHPGQQLRVRLADRALRQVNPLLGTLSRLLELPVGRSGASSLLDLCADPAVRRRFSFTDSDLERLHDLVPAAGVRWGLDAEHRRPFKMHLFPHNTWQTGLRRMLLGVALSEDGQPFRDTVSPLDDIDSSDVDLVGRLVEFWSRLVRVVDSFTDPKPLAEWLTACRDALTELTEVPPGERWQMAHAWTEFARLAEDTGPPESAGETVATGDTVLTPAEVRGMLADAFAGRPSRANFRTGALTLCTMTPMRTVPHRVVCLLGLDDGVFPRRTHPDGDDLLAGEPWVGDRDPRSEDRQVLLDAVLSATERLLVVHSGASPQTGEPRPLSVPLTELRDALTELLSDPADAHRLVSRHSLQPFASSNFTLPGPFSFDASMRAAALASATAGTSEPTVPEVGELPDLPELSGDHVEVPLADLQAFFAHPARAFLRRRAGLSSLTEDAAVLDEIPLALDGLQQWQIGERMLRAHLAGAPMDALRMPEVLRGGLPPFELGNRALDSLAEQVVAIARVARQHLVGPAESRWVDVDLGRWRLTGLVPGVHGGQAVEVNFSAVKGRHRLRAWLTLLALKCSHPETDWRSTVVGRRGHSISLGPISESDARARLNELLILHAQGLRRWLPAPPNTAAAHVESTLRGGSPEGVNRSWEFEHDNAWGFFVGSQLAELRAVPSTPEDRTRLRSRFEAIAFRVWEPLLAAEVSR